MSDFYSIKAKDGQSVTDIAMQEYGVAVGAVWLVQDNPGALSSITDKPAGGTVLNVRLTAKDVPAKKLEYIRQGKQYLVIKQVVNSTGGGGDPVTVKNSSNSYNVSAAPGTIVTLPNETLQNSDGSWSAVKPAVDGYTVPDTKIQDSAGTLIFNQPSAAVFTVPDSQVRKADGVTVAKAIKATQYCLTADVLAAMSAAEIRTDLNTNGQLAALLLAVTNAELLADLSDAQKGAIIAAASNALLYANLTDAQLDYITTILTDSNLDQLTADQVAYIVSTLDAAEIGLLTNAQLDLLDDDQITYIKSKYMLSGDFSASSVSPTQGQIINFNSGIVGADFQLWDFGDGNTSQLASPARSYAATGTYKVCLLAGNKTSGKSLAVVKDGYITVNPATGFPYDSVSGLTRVYSFERCFGSYVGFFARIRRSEDGSWADVSFDDTGNVSDNSPVSANGSALGILSDWIVNSSNVTGEIWYEQTANNKPASQLLTNKQPLLVKRGGLWCFLPDGVDDVMIDSTFAPAFPIAVNVVAYITGNSGGIFGGRDSSAWTMSATLLSSPNRIGLDSSQVTGAPTVNINQNQWLQLESAYNFTSGTGILNLNRGADISGNSSTQPITKLLLFQDRFQTGLAALREVVISPTRNSFIGDSQKTRNSIV